MGFLDGLESLLNGLDDLAKKFAESDTYKRMVENAERQKAAEIARTTGRNGLRCKIDNCYKMYDGTVSYCEGTVENIGKSTYSLVEVQVVFKNDEGKVVDKQEERVVRGTELLPGESMPFKVSSSAKNIRKASPSISRFEEI